MCGDCRDVRCVRRLPGGEGRPPPNAESVRLRSFAVTLTNSHTALNERDTVLTADFLPGTDGPWQSSRAKTLCRRGPRYVTGADLVRIARTLALEPWHFTQTAPAAADDPTGVVLDNARRRVTLRVANAAHGCVFHIRTLQGTGRCGLGDLAPASCRMFPALPGKGATRTGGEAVEEVRGGTGPRLDEEQLAEAERQWAADRDHWFELIARWNALAEKAETPPDVEDFQRYLLEAQTSREAGTPWPEDVVA
ncbi:hypothetical protein GCM10022420_008810 [Streptomyces iranensis]